MCDKQRTFEIATHEDCDEVWLTKHMGIYAYVFTFHWFQNSEKKFEETIEDLYITDFEPFSTAFKTFEYYVKDWELIKQTTPNGFPEIKAWKKPFKMQRLQDW